MIAISHTIKELIKEAGVTLGLDLSVIHLEHPDDMSYGDYSTNVALAHAKALGKSPREIAEQLKSEIEKLKF